MGVDVVLVAIQTGSCWSTDGVLARALTDHSAGEPSALELSLTYRLIVGINLVALAILAGAVIAQSLALRRALGSQHPAQNRNRPLA